MLWTADVAGLCQTRRTLDPRLPASVAAKPADGDGRAWTSAESGPLATCTGATSMDIGGQISKIS